MAAGVKDVALVQRRDEDLAEDGQVTLMFERLARDPNVDVDKLERLIAMQERILKHRAEEQFWEAFAQMQGELPTIAEDGAIKVNEVVRSRYSTNENIQECIRPVLKAHGFALTFRNSTNEKGAVCVTGVLAHRAGHKETDTFESAPDSGGQMNSIQRIGSTRSYGARYTTIALLNIVSRAPQDRDNDGAKSEQPPSPAGYEDWKLDMAAAADEGWPALSQAWNKSKKEYRDYVGRNDNAAWEALKSKSKKVGQ